MWTSFSGHFRLKISKIFSYCPGQENLESKYYGHAFRMGVRRGGQEGALDPPGRPK